MTTAAVPELWTDWCSVVGVPVESVDEPTLTRFSQQARPTKRTLAALRRALGPERPAAPAWPRAHAGDPESLRRFVRRVTIMVQDPATHWVQRIRLRRMVFAAALIAPPSHGGLGLDRTEAIALRPTDFVRLRPRIGIADDPASCPACAVWSWLAVIGTNNGWSHGAVKALGHRRDAGGAHRHAEPDVSPDWRLCVGMLPAVDRWGWIDGYFSVHPSSLSMIIGAMTIVLEGSEPVPSPEPEPRAPVREISDEERDAIFARADEVAARVEAILEEYG